MSLGSFREPLVMKLIQTFLSKTPLYRKAFLFGLKYFYKFKVNEGHKVKDNCAQKETTYTETNTQNLDIGITCL